jgi:hypothetical protein
MKNSFLMSIQFQFYKMSEYWRSDPEYYDYTLQYHIVHLKYVKMLALTPNVLTTTLKMVTFMLYNSMHLLCTIPHS